MTRLPPEPEQRQLLDRIVNLASITPSAQAVLRALFMQTIEAVRHHAPPKPLTAPQIRDACRHGKGPQGESVVYNALRELRDNLALFFTSHSEGVKEYIKVEIEAQSHVLRFSRNRKTSESIARFWEPYFSFFRTTHLYYPEPQFFRHRSGAYLRHPRANWRDQHTHVSGPLRLSDSDLRPSYSFIASGMTSAVLDLLECFHSNDADLHAEPLKTTDEFIPWNPEPVIVLGSPTTSLDLIRSIELDWPMRTRMEDGKMIFDETKTSSVDGMEEETDFERDRVFVKKYAIVTRRIERRPPKFREIPAHERVVTLFSGHSRSVQGVAQMLTMEESTKTLLQLLNGPLPRRFQALIEVHMRTKCGELLIEGANPIHIVDLDDKTS